MILNNADAVYLGSRSINKIYLGNNVVYETGGGEDIPTGYTRVAYLAQSASRGWFDTGIIPSLDLTLETRILINTVADDYFCSVRRTSATQTRYYLLNMNKDNGFVVTKSSWRTGSSDIGIKGDAMLNKYFDIVSSIKPTTVSMSVDGVSFTQAETTSSIASTPMPLFGYRVGTASGINTSSPVGTRCCYARFTQDGEVVRDLIPCLDTDGTPCFYDKITKETLYSTSGAFAYGMHEEDEPIQPLSLASMNEQSML